MKIHQTTPTTPLPINPPIILAIHDVPFGSGPTHNQAIRDHRILITHQQYDPSCVPPIVLWMVWASAKTKINQGVVSCLRMPPQIQMTWKISYSMLEFLSTHLK